MIQSPHNLAGSSHVSSEVNWLPAFRAFVGVVLLSLGVILGIYVVLNVFKLIDGQQPKLVTALMQEAEGAVDKAKDVAQDVGEVPDAARQMIKQGVIAADVKKFLAYGLVFFMLLIPVSLAGKLISGGMKLLRDDASEGLELIADRLRSNQSAE